MATTQTATMLAPGRGNRQGAVATVSLAVGPLIMAIGDLVHPQESTDPVRQAAIIVNQPDRWYLAHLLLLIGFLSAIPGLLALTGVVAARWPRIGHVARVLVLAGAAGLSAIFAIEMLAGRIALSGQAAATTYLDTLASWQIMLPVLIPAVGFFAGSAIVAVRLIRGARPLRWPAVAFLVGILLVITEIISAQVVFSQIGNTLIWVGNAGFAWHLRRAGTRAVAG